jgi:hypothetical protein
MRVWWSGVVFDPDVEMWIHHYVDNFAFGVGDLVLANVNTALPHPGRRPDEKISGRQGSNLAISWRPDLARPEIFT